MEEEDHIIVIDTGSGVTRAGFAEDNAPRETFPTVVGRPKYPGIMVGMINTSYVGDEALSKRGLLAIKHPIQRGIVTNWDDMEFLWHHLFYNELRVAPEEHPVLLIEPMLNSKANRERMVRTMFEVFNIPELYLRNTASLSLITSEKASGVVLDIGYSVTSIVPVFNEHVIYHSVFKSDLAGKDLTEYLMKILAERGNSYCFTTSAEREMVNDIKEKLCYVSEDFDGDMARSSESSVIDKPYELPSEEFLTIKNERFRCPEVLFKNSLLTNEDDVGIHNYVFNSVMQCDEEVRTDLFKNVVLCGGSSLFLGLAERLKNELVNLAPLDMHIKVIAREDRIHAAWQGGRRFASTIPNWVKKAEYDESGPEIVHRKCF